MEEENEEGRVEDQDHSTEVAVHHKEVEMLEDAADSVVADMVAVLVHPPVNIIKQYSIRGKLHVMFIIFMA